MSREAHPNRPPQLTALLEEACRGGLDIMDALLQQTREVLQRQRDQARDAAERDVRARALSALVQAAPALRLGYPEMLGAAFARELDDNPASSTFAPSGPASLKFDELELMDERQMQSRIDAGRDLQEALADLDTELAELDARVSALLGFEQSRPERNPLRAEVFLQALQDLVAQADDEAGARRAWAQVLVPQLGRALRPLYPALLAQLRSRAVPAAAPVAARPMPAVPDDGGLTLQQLHGLVAGTPGPDAPGLVQRVVHEVLDQLTADPRLLAPVRQLLQDLVPRLQPLALADAHFFSDKQHPARQMLEAIALRSFAYDSEQAEGFTDFLQTLRQALAVIDLRSAGQPATYAGVLEKLRRLWAQEDRLLQVRQQSAQQVLQQAERRNALAQALAAQIRARPDVGQLPAVVLDFACGPWAQVLAQAQLGHEALQALQPDQLLGELLWSVNPELSRGHPRQLTRLIPRLVAGLRQGLELIQYPTDQLQRFLDQLLVLHQGGLEALAAPAPAPAPAPVPPPPAGPWLAPEEARDSGFMDEPSAPTLPLALEPHHCASGSAFPATQPMGLEMPVPDFAGTVPMEIGDIPWQHEAARPPADTVPADLATSAARPAAGAMDLLQPGAWVELESGGQWSRLQLNWINEHGTFYLFAGARGSNHSMTRRMLERLLAEDRLRLLASSGVVERAFDAVAEQALRNSVRKDRQGPQGGGD